MSVFTTEVALQTFALALLVFGFAPGLALRMLLRAWPKGHARRRELHAEFRAIDYHKRPLWVFEQLETALFDGLPARVRHRRQRAARLEQASNSAISRHREIARTSLALALNGEVPLELVIFKVRRSLRALLRQRLYVALATSEGTRSLRALPPNRGFVSRALDDGGIHALQLSPQFNPGTLDWQKLPPHQRCGRTLEDLRCLGAWPTRYAIAMELRAPSGWRPARRTVALVNVEEHVDSSATVDVRFLSAIEVIRQGLEGDPEILGPVRPR